MSNDHATATTTSTTTIIIIIITIIIMLRLETTGRIKKVTSRKSDRYFPLSPTLIQCAQDHTIPWSDVYMTDSVFESVKVATYGRIRHGPSASEGSVAELVANPQSYIRTESVNDEDENNDHAVRQQHVEDVRRNAENLIGSGRLYRQEENWKSLSLAEIDAACGFTQIVPAGLELKPYNYQLDWPDRPFAESSAFDRQMDETEDLFRPYEASLSREFLSIPQEEIHIWAGCGQRFVSEEESPDYCCGSVRRNAYDSSEFGIRQRHRNAVRNQRVECSRNQGVYTHINNKNVNKLTPLRPGDNKANYIHMFSLTPITNERVSVKDEVLNQDCYLRRDLTVDEMERLYPDQVEIGFLQLHSAVESSLDKDVQSRLVAQTHPFAGESVEFLREEERLLHHNDSKGAAFPNADQLYDLGEFRLLNIDLHRWGEEQISDEEDAELPINHCRMRNRNDKRLDNIDTRTFADEEMAFPSMKCVREDLEIEGTLTWAEKTGAEKNRLLASEAK